VVNGFESIRESFRKWKGVQVVAAEVGQFAATKAEQMMVLAGVRIVVSCGAGVGNLGDGSDLNEEIENPIDRCPRNLRVLCRDESVDLVGRWGGPCGPQRPQEPSDAGRLGGPCGGGTAPPTA